MFPLRLADRDADRKWRATAKRPLERVGRAPTGAASGPVEGHYPFPPGGRLWTKHRVRSMDVADAGRAASPPLCSVWPWWRQARQPSPSPPRRAPAPGRPLPRPRCRCEGTRDSCPRSDLRRARSGGDSAVPRRHSGTPRPLRAGGRGAGGLRPALAAVPALPDARAVREEFGPTPATSRGSPPHSDGRG